MKNIYSQLPEFSGKFSPLVIATVIFTRGSAPQKAGSSAVFSKHGLIDGTIGGGILEARVEKLAREAAAGGKVVIHNFELDKSIEDKSEAICGGQVSVLIESGIEKYNSVFSKINDYLKRRESCVVITDIKSVSGSSPVIERMVVSEDNMETISAELAPRLKKDLINLLKYPPAENFTSVRIGKPGQEPDELILLEAVTPLPRLIIAGAGHIGRALHHLGRLLDFEVTVVDNRPDFARRENLPDASHIIVKDIEEAFSTIGFSKDSYVVIVTRGHNDDAAALRGCIGSDARYVGMIGSKTKIEKMHRNFIENGWATEKQWKAIHSPVGLSIKSKTVEEIAVSIAAELILVRNS
jgi:xanthine dehydrogenase accessory factor